MHDLPLLLVRSVQVWPGVARLQAAMKLDTLPRDVSRGAFYLSGDDQDRAQIAEHARDYSLKWPLP